MDDMDDQQQSQIIDLADRMIMNGAHPGSDDVLGVGKTIHGMAGRAHGTLGGLLFIPLAVIGGLGAMAHLLSKNG